MPEGDLELDAVFLNSSHLFVNWTEPNSPNGELRYQVNVTSTNILLNSELFLLSQDITGSPLPTSVLLPVEEMFYTRYLVSVEAFTDVGGGGRATLELTTPQGGESNKESSSFMVVMVILVIGNKVRGTRVNYKNISHHTHLLGIA